MTVGFVGFGEAGSGIARGLRSAGVERIFAYDINTNDATFGPRIRERARVAQTTLVESPNALAEATDVMFSTVTSSSALDAAKQNAPFLAPRHIYADLNSVSPALKQDIDRVISAAGASFVEVAVMAPVGPYGHKVPMLLGGAGARRFADAMAPFGMRIDILEGAKVGSAAAVKMCRSIVVKGIEALLFECVMAATKFDADDLVFASLAETWPGIDWKKLADYTSGRVVVHGERRAREMEEVAETLRAVGIDPIMAEATARRQEWSALMDLRSHFGPEGPTAYRDVVDLIAQIGSAAPGSLNATVKPLDVADRTWTFLDGSTRSAVALNTFAIGRGCYLPGWRWSEHVGKQTGRDSAAHVGYVLSGRLRMRDADGHETDVGPGEAFAIGPGHDAWVLGDEPCIALDLEHLPSRSGRA